MVSTLRHLICTTHDLFRMARFTELIKRLHADLLPKYVLCGGGMLITAWNLFKILIFRHHLFEW
jgi:hypothetical protein